MKSSILYCLLCLAALCLATPTTATAQIDKPAESKQADDAQTLRVLLDEVRQLRLALQRANLSGFRFQMVGERIRLQQGRVSSLTRELEGVRSQLTKLKTSLVQNAESLKRLEEEISRATPSTDANQRAIIESEVKEIKHRVGSLTQQEEQQRQLEVQLSGQLQAEQAKLDELNSRLDILERELEMLPAK